MNAKKTFKILSIDGGGIRGVYSAHILKRIEEEFDIKLHDYFDLIAVTSTGSIIAAAIACDISLDGVVQLYKDRGSEIFSKKVWWKFPKWFSSKFHSEELNKILVEKFGEEAYIIMEEIEKQRAEINEQLKLAKELAQATDKEFMVDEKSQLAHAYITNALEAIKNAQKEITHSNLETLTSEIGKVAVDPCITNAKEHNATAIKETVRAQRLLENILTGDDKNNKAVKES